MGSYRRIYWKLLFSPLTSDMVGNGVVMFRHRCVMVCLEV